MKKFSAMAGLLILVLLTLTGWTLIGQKDPGDEDAILLMLGPIGALWFFSRGSKNILPLHGILGWIISIGAAVPLMALAGIGLLENRPAAFIVFGLRVGFLMAMGALIDAYILAVAGGKFLEPPKLR